jgi:serine/threonine protein kinase
MVNVEQEIKIMSQIDSEFCIRYYGSYLKGTSLWIVMEFCAGGSCLDLVGWRLHSTLCTMPSENLSF